MSLKSLNDKLNKAAKLVDSCAADIKDSELQPSEQYIYKIGEILAGIFEIQHKIYEIEPSLTPKHLKLKPDHPKANAALNLAYRKALEYEDNGEIDSAINTFQEFIDMKFPARYSNIAKSEIVRLRGKSK